MDPDANLADQEWTLQAAERGEPIDHAELSELRQALYDWIRDGGFEPNWSAAPLARKHYGK